MKENYSDYEIICHSFQEIKNKLKWFPNANAWL